MSCHVLYVDHNGHPAPLTQCYHAMASRQLSSAVSNRFPPTTLLQIDSAYCPHCLAFHDAASAARLGSCPTCLACPVCSDNTTVVSLNTCRVNVVQDGVHYYCVIECPTCSWDSRQCNLQQAVESKSTITESGRHVYDQDELTAAVKQLYADLEQRKRVQRNDILDHYQKLNQAWVQGIKANNVNNSSNTRRSVLLNQQKSLHVDDWSISTLEAQMQNKMKGFSETPTAVEGLSFNTISLDDDSNKFIKPLDESLHKYTLDTLLSQAPNTVALPTTTLLPISIPLRPRTSRRCRAEMAAGRPGILLKPKLNPLEGDTSLKTGHGQWWKKDASAYNVVPHVEVIKYDQSSDKYVVLLVKVHNPTLGPVKLRFIASSYQGEPDWNAENGSSASQKLPELLVDGLAQTQWTANLVTDMTMSSTDWITLQSAEDALLDAASIRSPASIKTWSASLELSDNDNVMHTKLVDTKVSTAWIEMAVSLPSIASSPIPAFPVTMQIQVGDGSWESSLITPKSGSDEPDYVNFDLLLLYKKSKTNEVTI